jgi:hypothetical protein
MLGWLTGGSAAAKSAANEGGPVDELPIPAPGTAVDEEEGTVSLNMSAHYSVLTIGDRI